MSYYSDERPVRRHKSGRDKRNREYVEDEQYVARGGVDPRDNANMSLVRRRDDSVSSVEEVRRDFAPGEGGYVKRKTTVREGVRPVRRARSVGRDKYDDGYDDDPRRSDTYVSSKRSSKRTDDRSRRSRRHDDYSDESSPSRSPPRRRDSMGEKALAALGLGGAAAAIAKRSRSQSRSRVSRRSDRDYSDDSRSRSRSRGGKSSKDKGGMTQDKIAQAVKAALAAGAAEAVRQRKEPGGWSGDKGKRIITAAIGAAGVNSMLDRDPDKHSKRHIVESALAGLAANRVINGSRSKSRGPQGRGRDRSESRGGSGIKDLAAAGGLAAAGKALFDRARSKSRGRDRSRSVSSYSSYDSRSPPRHRGGDKKRSSSIGAMASKGLAALGLGAAADKADDRDDRRSSRRDRGGYEDDYRSSRNGYGDSRDVGQPRSVTSGAAPSGISRDATHSPTYDHEPHHLGDPETDSDSDLGSSSDETNRMKKMRRKQLLTAGLASVATIHAAHNVYQSVEARNERHKAVKEGEISKQEAKKEKTKARLQDAASIGIAALGIKGAFSEWKEMKEMREEAHEFREKQERHREKRERRRAKMQADKQGGGQPGYGAPPGAGPYLANGQYSGSAPTLATSGGGMGPGYGGYTPPPQSAGPMVYHDGNPYAASGALPAQGPMPGQGYPPPPPNGAQQRY